MKQQKVTPTMIISAIVVVVLVLVFLAWRTFGNQARTADLQTIKANQAKKAND